MNSASDPGLSISKKDGKVYWGLAALERSQGKKVVVIGEEKVPDEILPQLGGDFIVTLIKWKDTFYDNR